MWTCRTKSCGNANAQDSVDCEACGRPRGRTVRTPWFSAPGMRSARERRVAAPRKPVRTVPHSERAAAEQRRQRIAELRHVAARLEVLSSGEETFGFTETELLEMSEKLKMLADRMRRYRADPT